MPKTKGVGHSSVTAGLRSSVPTYLIQFSFSFFFGNRTTAEVGREKESSHLLL